MAAYPHDAFTWNTTAGNKTVTITPALGDLIVVIAANSGTSTVPTITDDRGGTYFADSGGREQNATADRMDFYIREQPVQVAALHTLTMNVGGAGTGGGHLGAAISGMAKYGGNAFRNGGVQSKRPEAPRLQSRWRRRSTSGPRTSSSSPFQYDATTAAVTEPSGLHRNVGTLATTLRPQGWKPRRETAVRPGRRSRLSRTSGTAYGRWRSSSMLRHRPPMGLVVPSVPDSRTSYFVVASPSPRRTSPTRMSKGPVTEIAVIGGAVAQGVTPARTSRITSQGATAGGNTPLPRTVLTVQGATAGGTAPTSSATVTSQGALAGGTTPAPQIILTSQGATGQGVSPVATGLAIFTIQGALAGGAGPGASAPPGQGGSTGNGTGPIAVVTFTSQGATAGGVSPVATATAVFTIQGALAQGNTPAPTTTLTSQGGTGQGVSPTSNSTLTIQGALGQGTGPGADVPAGPGGSNSTGAGPTAVVTLTSQGATAGGPSPTDSTGVTDLPTIGGATAGGTGPLASSAPPRRARRLAVPPHRLHDPHVQGALAQGVGAGASSSPTPGGGTADDGTILAIVSVLSQGAPGVGRPPGAVVTVAAGGATAGGTAPSEYYFETPTRGGANAAGNAPGANATSSPGGALAGGPGASASSTTTPGGADAAGRGRARSSSSPPAERLAAATRRTSRTPTSPHPAALSPRVSSRAPTSSSTPVERLLAATRPALPSRRRSPPAVPSLAGMGPSAEAAADMGGTVTSFGTTTAYVTFGPGAAIGAGNAPTEIGVTPPTPVGPTPGSGNAKRVRVLHNRIEILDEIRDEDEEEALLLLGLSLE